MYVNRRVAKISVKSYKAVGDVACDYKRSHFVDRQTDSGRRHRHRHPQTRCLTIKVTYSNGVKLHYRKEHTNTLYMYKISHKPNTNNSTCLQQIYHQRTNVVTHLRILTCRNVGLWQQTTVLHFLKCDQCILFYND